MDIEKLIFSKQRKKLLRQLDVEALPVQQLQSIVSELFQRALEEKFCFKVFTRICGQISADVFLKASREILGFASHFFDRGEVFQALQLLLEKNKNDQRVVSALLSGAQENSLGLCVLFMELGGTLDDLILFMASRGLNFLVKMLVFVLRQVDADDISLGESPRFTGVLQQIVDSIFGNDLTYKQVKNRLTLLKLAQYQPDAQFVDISMRRLRDRRAKGDGLKLNLELIQMLLCSQMVPVNEVVLLLRDIMGRLMDEGVTPSKSELFELFESLARLACKVDLSQIVSLVLELQGSFQADGRRTKALVQKLISALPAVQVQAHRLFSMQNYYVSYFTTQYLISKRLLGDCDLEELLENCNVMEDDQVESIFELLKGAPPESVNLQTVRTFAETQPLGTRLKLIGALPELFGTFREEVVAQFVKAVSEFGSGNYDRTVLKIMSREAAPLDAQLLLPLNSFFVNVQRSTNVLLESVANQQDILYVLKFFCNSYQNETGPLVTQIALCLQDFYLLKFKDAKLTVDNILTRLLENLSDGELQNLLSKLTLSMRSAYQQIRFNAAVALSRFLELQFPKTLVRLFADFKFIDERQIKFAILRAIQLAGKSMTLGRMRQLMPFLNFALRESEHSIRSVGIEAAAEFVLNPAADEKMRVHLLNMVHPNFIDPGYVGEVSFFVKACAVTPEAKILARYLEIGLFATAQRVRDAYAGLIDLYKERCPEWWMWLVGPRVSRSELDL